MSGKRDKKVNRILNYIIFFLVASILIFGTTVYLQSQSQYKLNFVWNPWQYPTFWEPFNRSGLYGDTVGLEEMRNKYGGEILDNYRYGYEILFTTDDTIIISDKGIKKGDITIKKGLTAEEKRENNPGFYDLVCRDYQPEKGDKVLDVVCKTDAEFIELVREPESYTLVHAPCTASMYPMISCGDKLVISKNPYVIENLIPGNYIYFDSPKGTGRIVRRIVDIEKSFFENEPIKIKTKGNNIKEIDDWVLTEEDNIRKVIALVETGY